MPRRARFVVDDGIYHVLSRGNNRQYIFKEDEDFIEIRKLILHYKQKHRLAIYHYSLMSSHIHMIIKSPDGESLSKAMKGIKLRYTQYYDEKYGSIGHLWQERYFKEGVYGTKEFAEQMRKKGLLPLWSHRGRPQKKKGPVPFLFFLL